jgi:hypothetical protein
MARKRKYKNAAEKQKAFRLRHGQKVKVPVEIRRGEKLGSQETDLRAKKEGETWDGAEIYEIQYQHEQSLKKLGVGRKARKRRTAK